MYVQQNDYISTCSQGYNGLNCFACTYVQMNNYICTVYISGNCEIRNYVEIYHLLMKYLSTGYG